MSRVAIKCDKVGVLIPIRVKPRGRANAIEGVRNDALLVSVVAPPADGAANSAVVQVLANALGCSRSSIEIVMGHKSRDKSVRVTGYSAEEVQEKLDALALSSS